MEWLIYLACMFVAGFFFGRTYERDFRHDR